MSKTIGIIGTRRRDSLRDFEIVRNKFYEIYEERDGICSGLCPKGGDRFAVMLADEVELSDDKRVWHKANWDEHGKAAGFIRNTYIARDSDILIACVADDRKGGTEDTIKRYLKLGKRCLHLT